uniref:ATPase subunit 8 n=1 Tax=Neogymnocrinus richeri TaxID=710152 RepID=Q2QJF2_9ECHI|nr:ATP synthase F0 subunit 8 [Neogymnocrinus richeri]AAY51814.1 ATPase subunit 8 [Neogymnocrinus richeri]
MPQLDFFWWGFNFFVCWGFLFIMFVYFINLKFLVVYSSSFYGLSPECSGYSSFVWLW